MGLSEAPAVAGGHFRPARMGQWPDREGGVTSSF